MSSIKFYVYFNIEMDYILICLTWYLNPVMILRLVIYSPQIWYIYNIYNRLETVSDSIMTKDPRMDVDEDIKEEQTNEEEIEEVERGMLAHNIWLRSMFSADYLFWFYILVKTANSKPCDPIRSVNL